VRANVARYSTSKRARKLNSIAATRRGQEMLFKSPPLVTSKFTTSIRIDEIILGCKHFLESVVVFKVLRLNLLALDLGTDAQQVSDSFRFHLRSHCQNKPSLPSLVIVIRIDRDTPLHTPPGGGAGDTSLLAV